MECNKDSELDGLNQKCSQNPCYGSLGANSGTFKRRLDIEGRNFLSRLKQGKTKGKMEKKALVNKEEEKGGKEENCW